MWNNKRIREKFIPYIGMRYLPAYLLQVWLVIHLKKGDQDEFWREIESDKKTCNILFNYFFFSEQFHVIASGMQGLLPNIFNPIKSAQYCQKVVCGFQDTVDHRTASL